MGLKRAKSFGNTLNLHFIENIVENSGNHWQTFLVIAFIWRLRNHKKVLNLFEKLDLPYWKSSYCSLFLTNCFFALYFLNCGLYYIFRLKHGLIGLRTDFYKQQIFFQQNIFTQIFLLRHVHTAFTPLKPQVW